MQRAQYIEYDEILDHSGVKDLVNTHFDSS